MVLVAKQDFDNDDAAAAFLRGLLYHHFLFRNGLDTFVSSSPYTRHGLLLEETLHMPYPHGSPTRHQPTLMAARHTRVRCLHETYLGRLLQASAQDTAL